MTRIRVRLHCVVLHGLYKKNEPTYVRISPSNVRMDCGRSMVNITLASKYCRILSLDNQQARCIPGDPPFTFTIIIG